MLRQSNLDDERFSEMVERSRLRAAEYFPAWNDYNSHDPGIMLIELLSWLTEMQRFHMDQSEYAAAFFPLLGITPRRVFPAKAVVCLQHDAPETIPAGTPIMAEDICFELEQPLYRRTPRQTPLKVIQRHTLCEDIPWNNGKKPNTYLSQTGESMFFCETGGVYMRIRPEEGVDARSQLENGACIHVVSCEHGALRSRVPGIANGFPGQRFTVDTRGQRILHDGFTLLIGEDMEMSRARRWTLVDSFRASSPSDTHYTLNAEAGIIAFGDGVRGFMPKGVVFIAAMALTHGIGGNIMSERLTELSYGDCRLMLVQPHPAEGGAERESTAETMARLQAEKRQAVTAEDIQALVMEAPGIDIERVCAFSDDETMAPGSPRLVTIAVKPFGERAQLSEEQRRAIRVYLEPYRLAGFEYKVVPPKYAGIRLTITLYAGRHDEGFARTVEETIRDYFRRTFHEFGAKIGCGGMAAFLAGIGEVSQIRMCKAETYSNDARRDVRGDIYLAQDALAYLEELHVRIVGSAK